MREEKKAAPAAVAGPVVAWHQIAEPPAVGVPGWKLLPIDPTLELLCATMSDGEEDAARGFPQEHMQLLLERAGIRARYARILAAAPTIQAALQPEAVPSATFDGVIPAAIRSYLRRCSSGGMSKKHIDIVHANVDEAERLGYFKLAIAEAVIASRVAAPHQEAREPAVVAQGDALTYEQSYAIRQGHEIASSDAYFEARPQIDNNDRRGVFRAGFDRGWDAARSHAKKGGA